MPRGTKPFTDLGIDKLKITGKRYQKTEGDGLYICVNAAGEKTWKSYHLTPDGKVRWQSIGHYPAIGIKKARELNKRFQQSLKDRGHAEVAKDGLSPDPTLEEVYKLFIKKAVDRKGNALRENTVKGYEQAFDKDILPFLGKRKIAELRKRDIIPVLERIVIH